MEDPVQIVVMGQKFVLKGNHNQEYVKRVEKYINEKIQEVQKSVSSTNTHNLMILVALNLIDDYFKKEEEYSELLGKVEGASEHLINLIDSTG